ncbi:MAG TPA: hypothetical protein VNH20_05645 [Candidatus Dormibacteraeota bacterium]|nr:hypothetical protein [Candidatus Dormibacteraeota bacterium]
MRASVVAAGQGRIGGVGLGLGLGCDDGLELDAVDGVGLGTTGLPQPASARTPAAKRTALPNTAAPP